MKKFKKISLIVVSLVVFAMSLFAEPPYKPSKGWVRGTDMIAMLYLTKNI